MNDILRSAYNAAPNDWVQRRLEIYKKKEPGAIHPDLAQPYSELIEFAEKFAKNQVDQNEHKTLCSSIKEEPMVFNFDLEKLINWIQQCEHSTREDKRNTALSKEQPILQSSLQFFGQPSSSSKAPQVLTVDVGENPKQLLTAINNYVTQYKTASLPSHQDKLYNRFKMPGYEKLDVPDLYKLWKKFKFIYDNNKGQLFDKINLLKFALTTQFQIIIEDARRLSILVTERAFEEGINLNKVFLNDTESDFLLKIYQQLKYLNIDVDEEFSEVINSTRA